MKRNFLDMNVNGVVMKILKGKKENYLFTKENISKDIREKHFTVI